MQRNWVWWMFFQSWIFKKLSSRPYWVIWFALISIDSLWIKHTTSWSCMAFMSLCVLREIWICPNVGLEGSALAKRDVINVFILKGFLANKILKEMVLLGWFAMKIFATRVFWHFKTLHYLKLCTISRNKLNDTNGDFIGLWLMFQVIWSHDNLKSNHCYLNYYYLFLIFWNYFFNTFL